MISALQHSIALLSPAGGDAEKIRATLAKIRADSASCSTFILVLDEQRAVSKVVSTTIPRTGSDDSSTTTVAHTIPRTGSEEFNNYGRAAESA
eukprot:3935721-Rhodomonas_salina.3